MTRALVWKELREQWAVGLTLALAAAAGAAGLVALLAPSRDRDELLLAVLWLSAWSYGLVCGALLLAGEAEGGTQDFLDALPATRRRLWRAKALTGLLLLAAQAAALAGLGLALSRGGYLAPWAKVALAGTLLCGAVGYGWGLYGGAVAASVLGAVARAVLLQAACCVGLWSVVVLALHAWAGPDRPVVEPAAMLTALVLIAAGLATRSRALYCRTDRHRASPSATAGRLRWGGAFGLAWTRARRVALGVAAFAVFGVVLVVNLGVVVWPAVTLILGVFCGLTASAGAARAAPGRLALVRAGVHLALAVGGAALVALPPAAMLAFQVETLPANQTHYGVWRPFQFGVAAGLLTQPVLSLTIWVVYGWAAGLLAGSAVRGPVTAVGVALGVAVVFGGLWVPSAVAGGHLYAWQAWGPVVPLLAAAGLLMRERSAGRSTARRDVGVAAGAVVAAGVWLAAALWYRAVEIPAAPDAIDVAAFRASLPSGEANAGGRLAASALARLSVFEQNFVGEPPRPRLPPPGGAEPAGGTFSQYMYRLWRLQEEGWVAGDGQLAAFLDRVFAEEWARELAESADHPTGVAADPREATFSTPVRPRPADLAAQLLIARGLQRQADGDPAAFVGHLRSGLALARNLRHGCPSWGLWAGESVDTFRMLPAVERWLERLDGRPDLLRRALDALRQRLDEPPIDPGQARKADFLLALNTFADPANFPAARVGEDPFFPRAPNAVGVLQACRRVPWEEARIRRLLDGLASEDEALRSLAEQRMPPLAQVAVHVFRSNRDIRGGRRSAWQECLAPVAALQVALRLYQAEKGRPAEQLGELTPKYLPQIPPDPVDGRPFRYRLSRGERLDWSGPGDRWVPAGQGILWCVGEDGRDDGGHSRQGLGTGRDDLIFLVPLPPGGR